MRYFVMMSLLFVGLLPGIARADAIMDGEHSVQSCLQIDNLSAYPDYHFVLSGTYKFPYSNIVMEGENCHLGGTGTVLAIKKMDWDEILYASEGSEEAGDWSSNPVNASLFVASGLNLSFPTVAPDTDPTVKKTYVVHIDAVTADRVQARVVQADAEDKNGSVGSSVPVTAIVIVALGLFGLGMAHRAWKK